MRFRIDLAFLLRLLSCWLFVISICSAETLKQQSVGRVTLVIGESYAIDSHGQKRRLRRESDIFVGDNIETNGGAHVHIKFIDDARISIRPQSRLRIESYHVDTRIPENSAIRFFLEQGVLRSISGKATEAAHHRYRMNTPIAALGVLGTDYVIRTSAERTWAAVYSGGIALAPLNNGCNYAGFGACKNAMALTAEMGNKYLEVNAGDNRTQIKSQIERINDSLSPKKHQQNKNNSENKLDNPLVSEGDNELASREKLGVESAAESEDAESSSGNTLLAWGRWPWQSKHSDDKVSKDRESASNGRDITIGNSYAGLFRAPSELLELQSNTGVYNFNLTNSHVVFIENGKQWHNATAAKLDKAKLQLDFGRRQFNTQLEMSSAQAGSTQLQVQGQIGNNGIFTGGAADGRVAGALSGDGSNAGMLFEREIGSGRFEGISEWRRK